ncbi:protocadherin beta-15-like, partial [Anneissia japonica]|uniref:protocadherin beta-15-like n=1 Tax=Anneissia japonica TaxID=1529436 RepID=UPI001425A27D
VAQVTAVDPDLNSPLTSRITYRITAGNINNIFTIKSDSGYVHTAKLLDFETMRAFSLQIEAADVDGRLGFATLNVTVLDVNDNDPVFPNGPYEFSFPENVGS